MSKISFQSFALITPSGTLKSLLYGCVIRIGLNPNLSPNTAFTGLSSIQYAPGCLIDNFSNYSSLSAPVSIQLHSTIDS